MIKKKLTSKQIFAETAGWYGAVAILAAYGLVSFSIISSHTLIFQLLNLTGALGFIVIATYKKVRQTVVVNIFWGIIALIAIFNIINP